MIETLRDNPQIILIPIITSIVFFIRLGLIGVKYDDAMRKVDSKYDGYNSFRIGSRGRMRIPNYLKKTDIREINDIVKRFNSNLTGMWISVVVIILIVIIIK